MNKTWSKILRKYLAKISIYDWWHIGSQKSIYLYCLLILAMIGVIFLTSKGVAQEPNSPFQLGANIVITPTSPQPFDKVIEGTKKIEGLFTLYRPKETQKLYLEIKPENLNKKFLCFLNLSSGIGETLFYRGMPLGDILFEFRRQENKVEFVIPNINFRTQTGDPQGTSVEKSFSNSILYSVPILSIHPQTKALLIDLSNIFISDRTDIAGVTPFLNLLLGASYKLDGDKSYFKEVKNFPKNLEIEANYGFSGDAESRFVDLPSVPDSRSFNLGIHYSIFPLPVNNGYHPRLADQRVGYFITAYKNVSEQNRTDPFVRYINRWRLEKKIPSAPLSPPVNPIVFWIENTVPLEYREAMKEGVLLWNKAFEKAGFLDAIQVKQMPDKADFDPEDMRYNVIRWSNFYRSFFAAIGPSHVDPMTGEILDSDIIINANIIRDAQKTYQNLLAKDSAFSNLVSLSDSLKKNPCYPFKLENNSLGNQAQGTPSKMTSKLPRLAEKYQRADLSKYGLEVINDSHFCFGLETEQQFDIGRMALSALSVKPPQGGDMKEFIHQYIRYLTAHEIGHNLGLRHNFHGSTFLKPEELNNTNITHTKGLVASVMDYVPINLAPLGTTQGDYYPVILGPYDEWAIAYGYQPFEGYGHGSAVPLSEKPMLDAIASQSSQPELSFGTDEDADAGLDPAINPFDLSNNMLQFSQVQLDNTRILWKKLEKFSPSSNVESPNMREMFDSLYLYYFRQLNPLLLYIGGESFNRPNEGFKGSSLPFEAISINEQRNALALLQKYVFAEDAFQFSPELLNKLAPARWRHWGTRLLVFPLDYPIGDRVTLLQRIVLLELLSPERLTRLRDSSLKTNPENVLSLPELFDTLQNGIWSEIFPSKEKVMKISNFRRSLQKEYLSYLIEMVLRKTDAPEDANAIAWSKIKELREAITQTLRERDKKLDAYSRTHLEETRDRITKALNSQLQSN